MTFWTEITVQLDRVEAEKPNTFDGVREILGGTGPDRAFFAGSGGDRSLRGSLIDAGWRSLWNDLGTHYYYTLVHPVTGDMLTYCEGDVFRGPEER